MRGRPCERTRQWLPRREAESDRQEGVGTPRLLGQGSELAQIRPYILGDDVRQIDWNVTARTGEPHVRVQHAERVLVTARHRTRVVIVRLADEGSEGLGVRRTRVLLVPADFA